VVPLRLLPVVALALLGFRFRVRSYGAHDRLPRVVRRCWSPLVCRAVVPPSARLCPRALVGPAARHLASSRGALGRGRRQCVLASRAGVGPATVNRAALNSSAIAVPKSRARKSLCGNEVFPRWSVNVGQSARSVARKRPLQCGTGCGSGLEVWTKAGQSVTEWDEMGQSVQNATS
jgi:hypothetical protein